MAVQFHPLPLHVFPEEQRAYLARLNAELRDIFSLESVIRNTKDIVRRSDRTIARRQEEQIHATRITPEVVTKDSTPGIDFDSSKFLRSDVSDNYTAGTLTFNSAAILSILGRAQLPITGASFHYGIDSATANTLILSDTNTNATGKLTQRFLLQNGNADVLEIKNLSPTGFGSEIQYLCGTSQTSSNKVRWIDQNQDATGKLGAVYSFENGNGDTFQATVQNTAVNFIGNQALSFASQNNGDITFAPSGSGNIAFNTVTGSLTSSGGPIALTTGDSATITASSGNVTLSSNSGSLTMDATELKLKETNASKTLLLQHAGGFGATVMKLDGGLFGNMEILGNGSNLAGTGMLIVNSGSTDFDTQFKGKTIANLFYIDTGADRVGINTGTPDTLFHVAGACHLAGAIQISGDITFDSAKNIILNTTTGTKIGTGTTQKLAFYNATPIVQPSSTGETIGFTAGTGTGVNDDSTFTGNVGSTAYRISDIVKHLKNMGLLAA